MQQAKPLIKWAGGKRGILQQLVSSMPENYGDYYEPFVGGGALFFELSPFSDKKAYLSDINDDLINTYKVVKTSKNKLMQALDELAKKHSEDFYYEMRSKHDLKDRVERASRFIFINKTGFNGLIRYNSKGEINTPWGHKKNPVRLYEKENIEACSNALKGAVIASQPFTKIKPKQGDFVYFDPPYFETYNSYSKDGFGEKGQKELADFCKKLDEQGVLFMLSNSDTPLINELYKDFNIKYITAPRAISCKGDGRKPVREVLVTNY